VQFRDAAARARPGANRLGQPPQLRAGAPVDRPGPRPGRCCRVEHDYANAVWAQTFEASTGWSAWSGKWSLAAVALNGGHDDSTPASS
jgi:hypothetical protein